MFWGPVGKIALGMGMVFCFADIVGIAGKQFPICADCSGNFRIYTAAAFFCGNVVESLFPVAAGRNVDTHGDVGVIGLEQGKGRIGFALRPFAFPTQFVVFTDFGREIAVVSICFRSRFLDECIACIEALPRHEIVSDADVWNEFAVFDRIGFCIVVRSACITGSVVIEVAFSMGIASACQQMQFFSRIDAGTCFKGVRIEMVVAVFSCEQ